VPLAVSSLVRGNVHAGGAGFGFGKGEGAFGLVERGLIIRRIQLDKNLTGFHLLVVAHLNFPTRP